MQIIVRKEFIRMNPPLFPAGSAPVRQLSESPAFRACRRRTAALLADKRRLEILRVLDTLAVPLTAGETIFVHNLLERARCRRYHCAFSPRERRVCDFLRRHYLPDDRNHP
jgi:hypothetical protein